MKNVSSVLLILAIFLTAAGLKSQDINKQTPPVGIEKKEFGSPEKHINGADKNTVATSDNTLNAPPDVLKILNKPKPAGSFPPLNFTNISQIYQDSMYTARGKPLQNNPVNKLGIFRIGNDKAMTDYVFQPTTGSYTEISGSTTGIMTGDDAISSAIDIGFTFNYNGVSYSQVKISTNGWLGLGAAISGPYNLNSLSGSYAAPVIAPLWDDLSSSNIQYSTSGTAPNRIFTVQWKGSMWYYSGGTAQNFQVKLYETSGMIQFVYGTMTAPGGSVSASIGINDMTAGSGHFISVSPGSPATASNTTEMSTISAVTYLTSGTIFEFLPKTYNIITPSTSIQYSNYLSQTVAMWNISANAGTTYAFNLCSDAEDSKIWIYNSSGIVVASLDDAGPYCAGTSSSIVWNCTSAGSYYVIAGYWNGSVFVNSGSLMYTLFPMNVTAFSGWVSPSSGVSSVSFTASSLPVWSFTAAAGTTYGFSLCAGTEDTQLWIYDGNNNLKGTVDDGGPYCSGLSASLVWTCDVSGNYFVIGGHYGGAVFTTASTLAYQTLPSPPSYRSYYSNSWNYPAAWQISTNNGTTWGAPCEYPTSKYSSITVQSGNTMTLNVSIPVDELNINSGGSVVINSGITLTVADGTGTDLTLNGTLDNSGTIINNGQIAVNNGGLYYHRCDGGIIPAASWGASSTCYVTGSKSQNPPVADGFDQNFGNFTWDCSSQSYWGWIPTVIQGSLNMINGYLMSAYTSPRASAIGSNLNMSGGNLAVTINTGTASLTVNGSISQTGGVLQHMLGSGAGSLILKGNWTKSGGTYSCNTGTTIFSGTSQQSIPALGFYSTTVNNPAGIVLTGPITTSNINLTSGSVTTSSANILTVSGTSVSDVSRTSGWINGPIKITLPVSLVTGSTYILPVGKSVYNPVEFVNPVTTSSGNVILTAEAFDGNCGGTPGQGLSSLSAQRYWYVSSSGGSLTSAFLRFTETGTLTGMSVGECSTVNGSYISVGKTVSGQTVMTNLINSLGYFALGNSDVSAMSGVYYVGLTLFNKISGKELKPELRIKETLDKAVVQSKSPDENYKMQISKKEYYILTEKGIEYSGRMYTESGSGDAPDAIRVYSTLGAAFSDLNARGVCGPVNLVLTDANYSYESYPLSLNQLSGSSQTNTVTIKPNSGNSVTLTGSSSSGIINLNGADNIIIDGSNCGGTDKSLTVSNNYPSGGYGIYLYGTANNNIIRNCNIKSEYKSVYITSSDNTEISADNIYGNVSGNTLTYETGIWLDAASTNTKIRKNFIHDFYYTGTSGYGTFGIYYNSDASSVTEITNNVIYSIKAGGDPGGIYWNPAGIFVNSGGNIKIYNNSIYMSGDVLGAGTYNGYGSCLSFNSTAQLLDVKNNALQNSMGRITSGTTAPSVYVVYSAAANTGFTDINYNDYYFTDQPNVTENLGYLGTAKPTLADWKTATGKDGGSYSGDPTFTSVSNLLPVNTNPNCWVLNGKGYPISAISSDIAGNPRSTAILSGPIDIGAYEFVPSGAGLTPPSAAANFAPGSGILSTYTLFGKVIGMIYWYPGGTYPTAMNLRYYTQTLPPNIGSSNSGYAYWDVNPAGSYNCSYDITLAFGDNETYSISQPALNSRMAKYNGSTWTAFLLGGTGTGQYEFNWNARTLKVYGLDAFSIFSLTDQNAPLPVNLLSFGCEVKNKNVNLLWSTGSETNNRGFDIEVKDIISKDSIWDKTGFVSGKGNSNSTNYYNFTDCNRNTGKFKYRLKQIDYNGNYNYYYLNTVVEVSVPDNYSLSQNYPNPFNPVTTIEYSLPVNTVVIIKLYDINGKEIRTLFNDKKTAGYYSCRIDCSSLSSGVYFYRIQTDGFVKTKKMLLIK